jgi:hypothetical protein
VRHLVDVFSFALLSVEIILLLLTILLLIYSSRERRQRQNLLNLLIDTIKVLTREEYFNIVVEELDNAKKSVCAIVTGEKPSENSAKFVERILKALKKAEDKGSSLRYIIPASPETLEMGLKYIQSGCDVRYNQNIIINELRFMVVDERRIVIGMPDKVDKLTCDVDQAELCKPTRRGVLLQSEALSKVFSNYFNSLWDSSIEYSAFAKQMAKEKSSNP